jgi:hypothetical protein
MGTVEMNWNYTFKWLTDPSQRKEKIYGEATKCVDLC